MEPISLRAFAQKVKRTRRKLRLFLTRLEKHPPRDLDKITSAIEPFVWKEVDCLSCANCCKSMVPTYTPADIKRISAHLGMTPAAFKDKWLEYDKKAKDWQNKLRPCQFLDLKNNKCSIYEVRPLDCSGFPHLSKKKMTEYIHVHHQNLQFCPATVIMVEKMKEAVAAGQ